ncbi:protein FAM228B isoform X5 [Monodelphis domestica]|uniref:protein FAM228B isoform X5 n=1 Tax=Monodelphis domestica TaxID=13616 RepID=UPI0024E1ED20|nr:protein FAM228B isoform X5 [Monodelphis domestica]
MWHGISGAFSHCLHSGWRVCAAFLAGPTSLGIPSCRPFLEFLCPQNGIGTVGRTLQGEKGLWLLFEPAMDRNPNYADFSPQRNLTENLEGLEVPFVEAFAKDDIDATVKAILCRENYVIKEVDKYLQHQDFLNARRREMLHKRWVENVASPLQQKIMDKVGSPREIEKRKCQELDGYLKFKNSVGYVSLETYDSKIYDPFYMMNKDPCYLKVILPPFHDPLLKAQDDRDEENRVLLECERGKIYTMKKFRDAEKAELLAKLPQTATVIRQNMGPNEWLAISAGYVESDHCKKSRLKVKVDRNRVSCDLREAFHPSEGAEDEASRVPDSPGGPTELDSSGTKGAASQARRPRTSLPKQPPEAKPHQEAAGDERRDSVQGAQQPVPKARQGANQNISDVAKDPP